MLGMCLIPTQKMEGKSRGGYPCVFGKQAREGQVARRFQHGLRNKKKTKRYAKAHEGIDEQDVSVQYLVENPIIQPPAFLYKLGNRSRKRCVV